MVKKFAALCTVILFTACSGNDEKAKATRESIDQAPSVETASKKESGNDCVIPDPDTSVSGIIIHDAESSAAVLGESIRGDSTTWFRSRNRKELLGLTVHAGSGRGSVSMFQVSLAEKDLKGMVLPIAIFQTEKGIRIGSSKDEVIQKLGSCYGVTSDDQGTTYTYTIQSPRDNRTALLARNNMPEYIAAYTFVKDKLVSFEFGFSYP